VTARPHAADDDIARRRERGIAAYARIFGLPEPDVPKAMADRVGPVFADEAFLSAGGSAWSHPALTSRDRSVVVITALVAQGVSGDRLHAHLRLARQHGIDHEALTAMMTLMAVYLGYARASEAMESVERIAEAGPSSATGGSPDLGRPVIDAHPQRVKAHPNRDQPNRSIP